MWVTVNKGGEKFLWLCDLKPVRDDVHGHWKVEVAKESRKPFIRLDNGLFPDLKWEGEQPLKVRIVLDSANVEVINVPSREEIEQKSDEISREVTHNQWKVYVHDEAGNTVGDTGVTEVDRYLRQFLAWFRSKKI